jgi:hypothetical protein
MKRKRGAQLGNSNAFKHGLYSASFSESENELLSSLSVQSFNDERELIRVVMRRAMEQLSRQQSLTLEESFSALRTFSLAAAVLERLHRSEKMAGRMSSPVPMELSTDTRSDSENTES